MKLFKKESSLDWAARVILSTPDLKFKSIIEVLEYYYREKSK